MYDPNKHASRTELLRIAEAAMNLREEDQRTTPRMFVGKKLYELGLKLDDALEAAASPLCKRCGINVMSDKVKEAPCLTDEKSFCPKAQNVKG